MAIQLISRLRDTYKIELPVQALFDGPTVADLAMNVEQQFQAIQDSEKMIDKMLDLVENLF